MLHPQAVAHCIQSIRPTTGYRTPMLGFQNLKALPFGCGTFQRCTLLACLHYLLAYTIYMICYGIGLLCLVLHPHLKILHGPQLVNRDISYSQNTYRNLRS